MMSLLLQFLFIASSIFLRLCTTEDFFVSPTPLPNPACPSGKPCHTLDEYAQNEQSLFGFSDNIHLLFLSGTHEMSNNSEQMLELSEVQQLILSNFEEFQVSVRLMNAAFLDIEMIKFENINFLMSSIQTSRPCSVSIINVLQEQSQFDCTETSKMMIQKSRFIDSQFTFSNYFFSTDDIYCSIDQNTPTFEINDTYLRGTSTFFKVDLASLPDHEIVLARVYNVFADGSKISVTSDYDTLSAVSKVFLEVVNCSVISANVDLLDLRPDRRFDVSLFNSSFLQSRTTVIAQALLLQNMLFAGTILEETAVYLKGPMNVTVDSCSFNDNYVLISSMKVDNVKLNFVRNSTFFNNSGSNGGAIYMSRSIIGLQSGTHVSFVKNMATQVGGAISVWEKVINAEQLRKQCFYQLNFKINEVHDVSLKFINNSAAIGGDNIFGTALRDDCIVSNSGRKNYEASHMIFEFQTVSLSSVSSNPKRVCLCNESGVPQCENINYIYHNVSVTPGEMFRLSAVLVGDDFGTVSGSVYASNVSEMHSNFIFSQGQNSQQITTNKQCSNLEYSVHPISKLVDEVQFILSTDSIAAASQRASLRRIYSRNSLCRKRYHIRQKCQNAPIVITVKLLSCPVGFELSPLPSLGYICQCEVGLRNYVHNCVVLNSQGEHYRNGSIWIGCSDKNQSDTILVHHLCPFEYCKADSIGTNLYNPDAQCALNHSGILCGGCPPNLSLAIGSSRCLPCPDNKFVSLFLVFALAGILLILVIKVFDLTVSHGTINGLVFYANAVWIYSGTFFSFGSEIQSSFSKYFIFLKVFIAWLNLDFGIETCFIQGLTAYWKIWLQLVFPFYIWILAGLIVVACHYSTRATKLFGNNGVPVLATLFLLSYAKLLRVIVLALGPAVLQQFHPDGTRWVWLMDGNVPYLGLRHAFLFFIALLILLVLWLPYTLTLLSSHHLRKLPCVSIHRLVIKFKPFFDTYTGPLKTKFHFWIGLTLLVRVLLAITAVAFQAINPVISIDILLLVCGVLCMVALYVFKKLVITCLELSFLFNLIILSVAFFSTDDTKSRMIFTSLSASISLMTFIGIFLYHIFLRVRKCFPLKIVRNGDEKNSSVQLKVANVIKPPATVSSTTIDLNECLLDSDIQDNL